MNKILIALLAVLASSSSMATSTHTCQGNSCNGGVATPSTTTSSSSSAGGSASSNVVGSGNSSNTIHATGGNSSATGGKGGSARATGGNAAGGTSSSTAQGGLGGVGGQGGVGEGGLGVGSQGQSVTVDSHVEAQRRAAASAYAAPLTSSNDTCMGSTSGAVQVPGVGLSVGSTWTDNNCVMLKNAREMWNMGLKEAALARLCMDANNKEAIEVSGVKCPVRRQEASSPAASSSGYSSSSYTGNDNIVRRRLGLPLVKEAN